MEAGALSLGSCAGYKAIKGVRHWWLESKKINE
jgi:hypothetical protein